MFLVWKKSTNNVSQLDFKVILDVSNNTVLAKIIRTLVFPQAKNDFKQGYFHLLL